MKTPFLKNFEELCETHHESCRSVLIKLGFAPSTIANWRKGSLPNVVTLNKIAEYFNVSIATLVGMTEEGVVDYTLSPMSKDLERINMAYRKASDDDRQIVLLALRKYFDEED